jgi:molybdenum cofactor cytidylyltransferase
MSKLPGGILLAAGSSSRFGANKLLHNVINDTPMLFTAAKNLAQVLPDSIAVINDGLVAYTEQLEQLGMNVVVNQQANCGIGSSIACGVQSSLEATGWLIQLADMPYIKVNTIAKLANKLKHGSNIVAPTFNQQRGHPVGFKQCYKNELLDLKGDVGARYIIEKHKKYLELIPTDDPGVILDIDQVSDIL